MIYKSTHIIFLFFALFSIHVGAQEATPDSVNTALNKSVIVVTDYKPSVSDASKINQLPQVEDTVSVDPNFQYSIDSKPVSTYYSLKDIHAARLKGEPLQPLYKLLAEAGIGNYWTTYANINYNSLRSRKHQYGVELYHFSQQGDVRLANDEKTNGGHSSNYLSVYGKKFMQSSTIIASAKAHRLSVRQYGYYTQDSIMEFPYDTTLNEDDIRQVFFMMDANIGLESNTMDSSKLHYNTSLAYEFTTPAADISENGIAINTRLYKYIKDITVAGDIGLEYYKIGGITNDSLASSGTTLSLSPWAESVTDKWKATVGFSLVNVWGFDQFRFFPNIAFDLNIADNIFIPYVKYNGWLESNNYRDIVLENPYIFDSLVVKPTSYQNIFKGGVRGTLSKNIPFDISIGYSDINDMHLFVNDYILTDSAQNKFNVIYDDVNVFSIHGETGYRKGERISILLKGDFYNYELEKEEKAWHKPKYQFGLSVMYNIQNKIITKVDGYFMGGMYAKNPFDSTAISMDNILDINLSVEYRYTKVLSIFGRVNNLFASTYSMWNQYPAYRFTAMLGLSYSLGKERH